MCDARSAFFSALVRNLEVVVVVGGAGAGVGVVMGVAFCCCCWDFLGSVDLSDGMRWWSRKEILSDFGRGGAGADFLIPRTSSRLVVLPGRETYMYMYMHMYNVQSMRHTRTCTCAILDLKFGTKLNSV